MIQHLELITDINVAPPDDLSRPQTFQLHFENQGWIAKIGSEVASVSTKPDFKIIVTLDLQPESAGMYIPLSVLQQGSIFTLWFNSYLAQEAGKGTVVRTWFEPAVQTSWKNIPIPDENKIDVLYKRTFTAKEYERIKFGMTPMAMEDRFFAYFHDNCLYFHNSWIGLGVFEVYFDANSNGAAITKVIAYKGPAIKGNPNYVEILDNLLGSLCEEAERIFDV